MKRFLLVLAWMLLPTLAYGQGAYYRSVVQTTTGQAVAGAQVTVCAYNSGQYSAVGAYTGSFPCVSPVTTYFDPGLTKPITVITSNGQGNFFFYVAAGTYTLTVMAPGRITNLGYSAAIGTSAAANAAPPAFSLQYNNGGPFGGDSALNYAPSTKALTVPSLNAIQMVDCTNAHGWAGSDIGAWINAAMAALPSTGGEVYVAANSCSFSTTIIITKNVSLHGADRNSTILTYTGTGDAIQMKAGNAPPYMNGAIFGLTLLGNANANAVGVHHIDTIGSLYDDFSIENFTGTNGAGIWFDNQSSFSERTSLRKMSIYRNTNGLKFTNTGGTPANTNSFSYWRVSEVHLQIAAGQTGIALNGSGLIGGTVPSVFLLNGEWGIDANLEATSSRFIALANGSAFSGGNFDLNAECTGCSATGIVVDSTSTLVGNGHVTLNNLTNTIVGPYIVQPFSTNFTGTGSLTYSISPNLFTPLLTQAQYFGTGTTYPTNLAATFNPSGTATNSNNFGSYTFNVVGSAWSGSAPYFDIWTLGDFVNTGSNPDSAIGFYRQVGPTSNQYFTIGTPPWANTSPNMLLLGNFAIDPTSPRDGSMWYNTTTHAVTCRQNGITGACGGGGGASVTVNGGSPIANPNFRNQTSSSYGGLLINMSNPSLGNIEANLTGTLSGTWDFSGLTSLVFPATANTTGLFYQTVQVGGTPVTQEKTVNYVAGSNATITPSIVGGVTTLTFAATNTAATAWSAVTAAVNSNAGTFGMSGNTLDLTAAAAALMPVSAAYAPTLDGSLGVNSTNHHWVFGTNGTTITLPLTKALVSNQFFTSYDQTTGLFTAAQPSFSNISGINTVPGGGSGAGTFTAHGVLMGETTSAFGVSAAGTAGQPFLSGGASADGAYGALDISTAAVTGLLPHAKIASTAVTPGSYTNANITVAADGSVTAAANGSATAGTVTTSGSPASPNMACFSGATAITNCNLSGDATTSGSAVVTVPKVNGVAYGTSPSTNTVPVVTGSNTVTYERVPTAAGGIGIDASALSGVLYDTAGIVSVSNALPNGVTATTQACSDNTTKVATDAFGFGCFANQALSNLASVAVNLALTPGTDNSIAIDSLTKRYTNAWFSGVMGWTNGSGTATAGISQDSVAGVIDLGNGTAGDKSATAQAASYVAGSTPPTACTGFHSCISWGEQLTAPAPTSGVDIEWHDYLNHYTSWSYNGGAFYPSTRSVGSLIGNDLASFNGNDVQDSGISAANGGLTSVFYNTATNCSSSASPAACASAASGSIAVPTGATPTLVVNTTAVTANSQILLTIDESLGTKLGITCNTTLSTLVQPVVTSRTSGTSFTIQMNSTLATNKACVSYTIVN